MRAIIASAAVLVLSAIPLTVCAYDTDVVAPILAAADSSPEFTPWKEIRLKCNGTSCGTVGFTDVAAEHFSPGCFSNRYIKYTSPDGTRNVWISLAISIKASGVRYMSVYDNDARAWSSWELLP